MQVSDSASLVLQLRSDAITGVESNLLPGGSFAHPWACAQLTS